VQSLSAPDTQIITGAVSMRCWNDTSGWSVLGSSIARFS
jgi:hypothetical protein